jgi:hypothetical protein
VTQDQFLIALYGIVTEAANAFAEFLTGQVILDGLDDLLEALSLLFLAADITLHWVREGVCLASDFA